MQIKNSFDPETKHKILASLKWALSPTVTAAIIDLATKAPKTTWWGILCIYVIPILINAIREYKAGIE